MPQTGYIEENTE